MWVTKYPSQEWCYVKKLTVMGYCWFSTTNLVSFNTSCSFKWLQLLLYPQCKKQLTLPRSGLSDVTGIVADTIFKKTVRLRRIVTPGRKLKFGEMILKSSEKYYYIIYQRLITWSKRHVVLRTTKKRKSRRTGFVHKYILEKVIRTR